MNSCSINHKIERSANLRQKNYFIYQRRGWHLSSHHLSIIDNSHSFELRPKHKNPEIWGRFFEKFKNIQLKLAEFLFLFQILYRFSLDQNLNF